MKNVINIVLLFILVISINVVAEEVFILEDNPNIGGISDFKVFSDGLPYLLTKEYWDDYDKKSYVYLFSCLNAICNKVNKSKLFVYQNYGDEIDETYELLSEESLFENVTGNPIVFLQKKPGYRSKEKTKIFILVCENKQCDKYTIKDFYTSSKQYNSSYFRYYSDKTTLPFASIVGIKFQCENSECTSISKNKWMKNLNKEDDFLRTSFSLSEHIVENYKTDISHYIKCTDDDCKKYKTIATQNRFFNYRCYDFDEFALSSIGRKQSKYYAYTKSSESKFTQNNFKWDLSGISDCEYNSGKYYISVNFGSKDNSEDRLLICSDSTCNMVLQNIDTTEYGGIKFIESSKDGSVWMATGGYSGVVLLKY